MGVRMTCSSASIITGAPLEQLEQKVGSAPVLQSWYTLKGIYHGWSQLERAKPTGAALEREVRA